MAATAPPVKRYRRWSIRVPRMLLFHVKSVAQKERWAFSDLMRMLIVLGATVSWLRLRKQENLDRLGKIAHASRVADMLNEAVSHKRRTRIYPVVRDDAGRATDVVTLILPAGYARLIEAYAATNRISKSDACERLLTFGLIAYSTAENALLQAIQRVRRQS
ncbi:MAG: hypothetical protein ABSA50_08740 [Candidatus Bathyarchaeia archaeon]